MRKQPIRSSRTSSTCSVTSCRSPTSMSTVRTSTHLRERVPVEHALARAGRRQGRRAAIAAAAIISMIGDGHRFLPISKRFCATSHWGLPLHWPLLPNRDAVQDSRSCEMLRNHAHFKPFDVLALRRPAAAPCRRHITQHSCANVAGPTTPSSTRPCLLWNALTAASVAGPKSPSAAASTRRWIHATIVPRSPLATL
jgi:hypothetical protein